MNCIESISNLRNRGERITKQISRRFEMLFFTLQNTDLIIRQIFSLAPIGLNASYDWISRS